MYKYAEILQAMTERAKVSDTPWDVVQSRALGYWVDLGSMPSFHDSHEYRIKPRIIKIGNREVSEPLLKGDLEVGEKYWFPSLLRITLVDWEVIKPYKHDVEETIFKRGLARRTEAEARELAEALLEVLNGH